MTRAEEAAFFGAMAQVVPVVLLAVLIEVKGLTRTLDADFPRWVRTFMGVWMGGVLVLLWAALTLCVNVLARPDFEPGYLGVQLVVISVGNGVAYVVMDALAPLLLRAFAEPLAMAADLSPRALMKRRTTRRLLGETRDAIAQDGRELHGAYRRMLELRRRSADLSERLVEVEALPRPWTYELHRDYSEAQQFLSEEIPRLDEVERMIDAWIVERRDRADLLAGRDREYLASVRAYDHDSRLKRYLQA